MTLPAARRRPAGGHRPLPIDTRPADVTPGDQGRDFIESFLARRRVNAPDPDRPVVELLRLGRMQLAAVAIDPRSSGETCRRAKLILAAGAGCLDSLAELVACAAASAVLDALRCRFGDEAVRRAVAGIDPAALMTGEERAALIEAG